MEGKKKNHCNIKVWLSRCSCQINIIVTLIIFQFGEGECYLDFAEINPMHYTKLKSRICCHLACHFSSKWEIMLYQDRIYPTEIFYITKQIVFNYKNDEDHTKWTALLWPNTSKHTLLFFALLIALQDSLRCLFVCVNTFSSFITMH